MDNEKYEVSQKTVGNLLGWISSGEIAIPEMQRPFVWSTTKVRNLLDSLYQGYPIGYIITWKNPDVKSKDGRLSEGRKVIIDGQQRITALMAAIVGKTVIDKHYKEARIRISFNPISENFATRTPAIAKDKEWIEDIATVFAPGRDSIDIYLDYMEQNPEADQKQVRQSLARLAKIETKQIGVIELKSDLDIETVTEIFIRINSEGVVLSQADFVLSKIASYGDFGTGLRKLIDYFSHMAKDPTFHKHIVGNDHKFVEGPYYKKIAWLKDENDSLYNPTYSDLTRVAFMKEFRRGKLADLVKLLSGRNFETRTFEKELEEENFKRFEKSLLGVVSEYDFKQFLMIVRSTGFVHGKMIASRGALNFSYTLYLIMREQKIDMNQIQSTVRRWFVASLLTSRYSSSPESAMDADIRAIDERGAAAVLEEIENSRLSDDFWEVGLLQSLRTTSISGPILNTYWAAQIYSQDKAFLSQNMHVRDLVEKRGDVHHIFPYDYLRQNGFERSLANQIANYTYAETPTNIKIKNRSPEDYFGDIVVQVGGGDVAYGGITDPNELSENMRQNCVPETVTTMTASDYSDFLDARRVLMAEKLKKYYQSL